MGTNYYQVCGEERCPCCGRGGDDRLHIGKSSGGWAFAVEIHPELGINNLEDWYQRLSEPTAKIQDEYGKSLGLDELKSIIEDRSNNSRENREPRGYSSWTEFDASNECYAGTNNLLFSRYRVHSSGKTWQCFEYEFS